MQQPLCAAPHCTIRDRHTDTCPAPDTCRGCLPRRAADGLRICTICTSRIGEDALTAAQLHDDLAQVLLHRSRGERTSGTGDPSPAIRDDVVETREAIYGTLTNLTKLISTERGILPPWEWRTEQLPPGFIGPPRRIRVGVGYPLALARYIAKHRDWLAAHPQADEHAGDLRAIAADGRIRALAYPCGSDRLYIGDCPLLVRDLDGVESTCGARLYQVADAPLIECPGCGTAETVEQWQRWIVGDARGVVDGYAAAAWLSLRWCRPVDPALIRQWAHRGRVQPLMEPLVRDGEPVVETVMRDGRQVQVPVEVPVRDSRGRVLYDLERLAAYATSIWGDPAPVRLRRVA
jgi:hypothetical protein